MLDKHVSRVTSTEMKYMRRVGGKTKKDRIINTIIRQSLKMSLLLQEI
jgi:hypothetical protein